MVRVFLLFVPIVASLEELVKEHGPAHALVFIRHFIQHTHDIHAALGIMDNLLDVWQEVLLTVLTLVLGTQLCPSSIAVR